jgi:UDP-GlcNAc:undecaprenyl-phosphate GlcNAc-1-phosphate transferase
MSVYLYAFILSLVLSAALTPLVRKYALKKGVIASRDKIQSLETEDIPYLGGLAVFAAFTVSAMAFLPMGRQLGAFLIGALILVVVGAIDDIRGVSPIWRLGWQFLAAGVVLAGGIGITAITSPFGGTVDLTFGRTAIDLLGFHFHITPIANLLSILWLVGMTNVINFLDGLDGLSSGVTGIAAVTLYLLALNVNQPVVALLAIILAGSAFGFLPYNFFPAKIFLGDAGAYFYGLTLALLAIYSGGKLATVLLVLGFTVIDSMWAVIRRLRRGTHPFSADREHLHHLLLQAGLSQRAAVLVLYVLAAGFGAVALASKSFEKLVALIILVAITVVLISSLIRLGNRRNQIS